MGYSLQRRRPGNEAPGGEVPAGPTPRYNSLSPLSSPLAGPSSIVEWATPSSLPLYTVTVSRSTSTHLCPRLAWNTTAEWSVTLADHHPTRPQPSYGVEGRLAGGALAQPPPLPYSRNTDMGASMFFVSSSLLGLDPVAANPPCGVRGRFGGPVPIQYHVRAVFSQAGDEVIAARGRRLGVSHSGSYPRNLGGTRTRPAGALGALISEDVTGAAEVPSAPFCQRRRGRRARGLGACPQRRWCPVSLLGASCPLAKWPSACVLVQRAAAAAMPRAD